MTRRTTGWLAVMGLVLVVAAFGVGLAHTVWARIRFWAWRARSSTRDVRLAARTRLMAIGRPAIDAVFPELVAGEVEDRLAAIPPARRVVLFGHFVPCYFNDRARAPFFDVPFVVERVLGPDRPGVVGVRLAEGELDPLAVSFLCATSRPHRTVIVGAEADVKDSVEKLLAIWLEDDDPLTPIVVEAIRFRLADAR